MSEKDIRQITKDAMRSQGGLRCASRAWGLPPSSLSDFMTGRRPPPAKLLRILDLKKVVTTTYVIATPPLPREDVAR
jgi:hypothetical protein